MNPKRSYCCFLAIPFIFLVASAMAASPVPQSIPVGAIVSLTGFDSNTGQQGKAGYEIAAEDINREGGIFVKEYGKKIPLDIIVQDAESDQRKAVSRMEWLHTSKKVVAYVGMTMINSGQGVAEKNKIPAVVIASPLQAAHERGLKYWFSPTGKTPDYPKIILNVFDGLPAAKRPKKAVVFQENTEYGVEQAEHFKKEIARRGYVLAAFEKYTPMSKDFSPLIMAAKNSGAELVLASPVAPDAMVLVRQMKELDYSPKALVIIRGAQDLSWGKAMGPMGDYVILSGFWHNAVKYAGVDKLNRAYQARVGRAADIVAGPAYASIQVLASAIEKAGTLDPVKIRDALAVTDMMTVIGRVKFRTNGTVIDPCPATVQWQHGDQKLVYPDEFKQNDLIYPMPGWKDR